MAIYPVLNSGLLIVSYPELDKDASIDFQYWMGDTSDKTSDDMEDDDDSLTTGIIIAAIVAVFLIFAIIAVMLCKSTKNAVDVSD